jgi:hypothetical protein
MKKFIRSVAGPIAAALLCVASGSPSHATTTVFVSGGGQDTNPCTIALPCRSIVHAVGTAGSGGIITCLDAGPYTENFTSLSSFTLDCRGVVYTTHSIAIFVITGTAVTFRNVIFDGALGGGGAVSIDGAKVVFQNCTFQNFTASPGEAVQFVPTAAGAHLTITDSVFANNGVAAGGGGIFIQPSAGVTAGAVIERTQVTGGTYGIIASGTAGGTALVEVRYSTIANNIADGIFSTTAGSVASVVVEHSASIRNVGSGINAQGTGAYVSLNDSFVGWNATGLSTALGGTILSLKNNFIAGNLLPGVTPLSFSPQ